MYVLGGGDCQPLTGRWDSTVDDDDIDEVRAAYFHAKPTLSFSFSIRCRCRNRLRCYKIQGKHSSTMFGGLCAVCVVCVCVCFVMGVAGDICV